MSARKRAEPSSDDDDAAEEVVLSDDDEDVPVARRQRLAPDFPRGAVLKVRMVNFMTYTDVTVEPGPRLNLILGPNGTGKSSMVCAICIGLAGSTKLLGRAKEVKEYVKRGESSATVVITLSSGNPAKPTVVTRKVTTDNKSEWKLNGAVVTQAKVVEAVAALNIQLDNLCQFLPQDRVVAFAQMSPTELLLETEKAFGARELFEQHTRLMEDKQGMKELETAVAATAASVETLKTVNAGLERDVERFQARAALLEKVEAMKAKLPWVRYEAARAAHETAKEDVAAAKKIVADKEALLDNFSAPLKAKQAKQAEVDEQVSDVNKRLKLLDAQQRSMEETFDNAVTEADAKKLDIADKKKQIATRAARLVKREAEIATLEEELDGLPSSAGRLAELEDIKARWRVDNVEFRKLEDEVADLANQLRLPKQEMQFHSDKLKSMADARYNRIEALRGAPGRQLANKGLQQAVEAVARLKAAGKFKREVYGPLLCEVQPHDKQLCNYLEQACQAFMWSMFVTQCDEDRDLMLSEIKVLGCSCVNFAGDPTPKEQPRALLQTLAKWGVTMTLDDAFDAPPVVKAVMRDQCGTSRAFVGSADSDKHVDEILAAGAPMLWTPTTQYVATKSNYDSSVRYTRMVPTRPSQLFTKTVGTASTAELAAKVKACQAKVAELQAAGTKAERARDEVQQRLDDLQKRREGLQKEERKLDQKRKELEKAIAAKKTSLESERRAKDVASEITRLETEMAAHQKKAVATALKSATLLTDLAAILMERAPLSLAKAELKEEARVLKAKLDEQSSELAQAKKNLAAAAEEANSWRAKAKALYTAAETNAKPTEELTAKFQELQLPDDADELEDLINSTVAEADGIMCANPGVMQDYKNRCLEIARQEKELASKSEELATHQSQLDAIRVAWLPKLRELFGKVSTAFAAAFAGIGCAGEVKLTEAGDDYAAYSVNIMVKFRANEQMRQLTASYQSGGERSVSTMLYLIALQDLTRCPFRVVDEINQGMDPKNERKIFQQMVASACAPGTPQCFLLTPKLLPQLTYSPEVSILSIFNGPWQRDVCVGWKNELMLGAPTSTEVC